MEAGHTQPEGVGAEEEVVAEYLEPEEAWRWWQGASSPARGGVSLGAGGDGGAYLHPEPEGVHLHPEGEVGAGHLQVPGHLFLI